MKKVKRVNISVYEDEWDELPKYIDVNRSEWVRQQVRKQISVNDDLKKIEMQIDAIEYQQKSLEMDKEFLMNEKKTIEERRKQNENDLKLINDVMFTIKTIAQNQGFIEKSRVEFIANKNFLDSNILLSQCDKEDIEIRDTEIIKEALQGLRSGKSL